MTTLSRSKAHEQGAASAALALAYDDCLVFPLVGKRPLTANGLHDATCDPEQIRRWWVRWPNANVGLRTGNGLVVLDVDGDDGAGADSLHDLEQRYKPLPRTRSVKTGGGGMHYYFAARVRVPNSAGRLGPGLDVRGEGGYVVAPPSVHPETGRAYEWDNAPGAVESQMLPAWLRGRLTDSRPAGPVRGVSFWRELAANGVREGARNDSCARLAGHLLSRGVDPFVCLELVIAWDAHRNQPSLGASEVSQVVRSIAQREVQRWL